MDVTKEKTLLLEADARWAEAARRRDAEAILSYWSDDAVMVGAGMGPVQGKQALREMVEGSIGQEEFAVDWTSAEAVVSDDASMGYVRGEMRLHVEDPERGWTDLVGPNLTVWRRDRDAGDWHCVMDMSAAMPVDPA